MTTRNSVPVLPVILLTVIVGAANASPTVSRSAPKAGAPAATPPHTPTSASAPAPNPIEIALKAQLDEMRRSEDRLLATVHWSLGIVVTLAVGLALFGWWSASRVYQRDIASLRDELKRGVDEAAGQLRADAERLLLKTATNLERSDKERYVEERSRLLSEAISYVLTHVADLRLAIGDLDGSARAAIELYHAAGRGNTNYIAHALDKLIAAFEAEASHAVPITPATIRAIRSILRECAAGPEGERVQRLETLLEHHG